MKAIRSFRALFAVCLSYAFFSAHSQDIIAYTRADFSIAGQGVNGFSIWVLPTYNVTGAFTVTGMTAVIIVMHGTGQHGTPIVAMSFMHPGQTQPAARRYKVGSDGESVVDGFIVIEGKFWDSQTGNSNGSVGFVTVGGVNIFAQDIPEGSTSITGFIAFRYGKV